jgi:hypothetical protein
VRLDASVKTMDKGLQGGPGGLFWAPSAQALRFIESVPAHRWGQKITPDFDGPLKEAGWHASPSFERILCRTRLRSAMIWVDDRGARVYLNAEHLGTVGPVTRRELSRKDRDPQRAADLDIFTYLVQRASRPGRNPP